MDDSVNPSGPIEPLKSRFGLKGTEPLILEKSVAHAVRLTLVASSSYSSKSMLLPSFFCRT